MSLSSGTKLGPYEIVSPLGAGGMGEVYRARDTKLNREVALKVLPESVASDPQRMARFEREAQVLASLNHPNIATIHGLEESGETRALVMELVDGQTVAEIVKARRAVPLPEALPIARQIAEGLEYAHERGIIHRDLKPANIKVTPDGAVKVLDFGLAKALDSDASGSNLSNSPTLSPTLSFAATQAGVILGTAAYMSPEQAKGKSVDRRTDVWAFGCVLYEMLAGKKAFEGEDLTETVVALMRNDVNWESLPGDTPPRIRSLIRRCLTKDPRHRLQAIGEARITIEETISGAGADADVSNGEGAPTGASPQIPAIQRTPFQRFLPWGVAALSIILAGVFAAAYFLRSPAASVKTLSLIPAPEKVTFDFYQPSGAPLLSPDGTRLVFPARDASGDSSLWLRPLDSLTAQPLQGTKDAEFPFWAPDSRQVGFFQDGKLKKIDVTGGPPVLICDAPSARGGTWSVNGTILFAPQQGITGKRNSSDFAQVASAGGTPSPVTTHKGSGGGFSNRWPVFLPDGRHFLYLSGNLAATGTSALGIYEGELGSSEMKSILQADSDAVYAAPGYLLFLRGDTLMAQRFDAGSSKLEGEAFPAAEHVGSPREFRLGLFSASQTGVMIYTVAPGEQGGHLAWLDESGKKSEDLPVTQKGINFQRLSPNGKRLAYVSGSFSTLKGDIWLLDLTRGVRSRFTFGPGFSFLPVWSPDGRRIAFGSTQTAGNIDLFVKDASGVGSPKLLFHSDTIKGPSDWSQDGRYILFTSMEGGNSKPGVWVLPLFGDQKPYPYLKEQSSQFGAMFSPDGRWVAFDSDASGSEEVYLAPFPNPTGKWQVSQGGGEQAQWSRDGKTVYYMTPGGKLMAASVAEKGAAIEVGTPRQLFQTTLGDSVLGALEYSVAAGGKRFLVNQAEQDVSPPLTLVTNWNSGLKK